MPTLWREMQARSECKIPTAAANGTRDALRGDNTRPSARARTFLSPTGEAFPIRAVMRWTGWMRRACGLTVAAVLGVGPVMAGPVSEGWRARVEARLSQPIFSNAWWGVQVVALRSGEVLYETNAVRLFRPASNAKLFVGALALDRLGPGTRIRTPLLAASRPTASGVLRGDLVIAGRGDFSWAARFHDGDYASSLAPVVQAVRRAGIRSIRGDLVGDVSFFRGPPWGTGWTWDDLDRYYGAPASPLTHEDNVIDIEVAPGRRVGESCRISLQPRTAFEEFVNQTETVAAGGERRVEVHRVPGARRVRVTGRVPVGSSNWVDAVSVPGAARWFLTQLRGELGRSGIPVSGKVRLTGEWEGGADPPRPASGLELAAVESPPVADLVRHMMKPSQNLYAQMLLLQVGARSSGGEPNRRTTEEQGIAELARFVRRAGLDPGEVRLDEGSGLSRTSLVTPRAVVSLLRYMARHESAGAFRASLPVAGVDGTLRRRLRGTSAEGRLLGKTGTMRGVYCLSGYVTTLAGEELAYAILLNHYFAESADEARRELDALAVILAEHPGATPR